MTIYPTNEAELVELFKLAQDRLGWRIVGLSCNTYPDATIENSHGQQLRVEFEYQARNFYTHGHDPAGCDLIVCWTNNWPEAPLPVWALADCPFPALAARWEGQRIIALKWQVVLLENELARTKRDLGAFRVYLSRLMAKAKTFVPSPERNPLVMLREEAFNAATGTIAVRVLTVVSGKLDAFFEAEP